MTIGKITFGTMFAALAVFALTFAQPVQADEMQINDRKAVMKGLGATMGGIKMIVEGKAPTAVAGPLAGAMAQLAHLAGSAFPEGSGGSNTRAKAEIWSKPAEFKAAVSAFQAAVGELGAAAKGGDAGAIKAAFGGVGKTCGGCHKPFRAPKS